MAKIAHLTLAQRVQLVTLAMVSLAVVAPLTLAAAVLGTAATILTVLMTALLILLVAIVEAALDLGNRIAGNKE